MAPSSLATDLFHLGELESVLVLGPKLHESHVGCLRQFCDDVCAGKQPGNRRKHNYAVNVHHSSAAEGEGWPAGGGCPHQKVKGGRRGGGCPHQKVKGGRRGRLPPPILDLERRNDLKSDIGTDFADAKFCLLSCVVVYV